MLETITYSLPQTNDAADFFKELTSLLGGLPYASVSQSAITLRAEQPKDALPITRFELKNVPFPQIRFDVNGLQLKAGNLGINPSQDFAINPPAPLAKTTKQDAQGEYVAMAAGNQTIFRLPIGELSRRLQGHVTRLDHTGINIPSAFASKEAWKQFISKLASSCNLYRYPTGEDWPFILPVTEQEFTHGIQNFPAGREPKFELVYDTFSPVPTIQIDIETDLPRPEIERLFPEPYGISFPDLADYFRTVYVDHEWPGLAIRFDLRFKNDNPGGDWETGKWLVADGGRIKAD